MPKILLLLPTKTYRSGAFMDAARAVGAQVVAASEEESVLAKLSPGSTLTLDFSDPPAAAQSAVLFAKKCPLDAVVAVDESSIKAAAAIAEKLGLRGNPLEAVNAAGNKLRLRELIRDAGVPAANFSVHTAEEDPRAAATDTTFPCVLKPARLAASRGVIRADNPDEFKKAFLRIRDLLDRPDVKEKSDGDRHIIVEDYIPGSEVALDGILETGRLRTLAIFDKPDPLEGPYFEETIYVTPSRLTSDRQALLADCAQAAAKALGLREGPVHAEMRVNENGPHLIEIAARSIGGLCSRVLGFGVGPTLEELILRNALGMDLGLFDQEPEPAGVMMLPIPRTGEFKELAGMSDAIAIPGIQDCVLTAHPGKKIEALPEGGDYLGFLFARGKDPAAVESSLRKAHKRLKVVYK